MAKTVWVSMQKLANDLKVDRQIVSNWVNRGNIKWKYDENVLMKVVDPSSINIKTVVKNKKGIWEIKGKKEHDAE